MFGDSVQAASRSGSGRLESIWCRAPKDSRSKRTHSAALGGEDAQRYTYRAAAVRAEIGLGVPAATQQADTATGVAQLRRVGDMRQARFQGRTSYLRDTKGMHDLAALQARPGQDLPALQLDGGTDPVLDRTALAAYRRRLAEIDDEIAAWTARSTAHPGPVSSTPWVRAVATS